MHFIELCKRFFLHITVFSFYYAFLELLIVLDRPISLKLHKPFSHKLLRLKERYIISWLKKNFGDVIAKYENIEETVIKPNKINELPIWICWLQGYNLAPNFVKKMIKNVKKNSNGHPVFLIDVDNYMQYCSLPANIVRKYKAGLMPQQQFADILRAGLLSQRGGLWIDASVFITRPIPDDVFNVPVYNIKNIKPNYYRDAVACDSTKWEAYFIASWPKSVTYSFIFECFIRYWEKYNVLIDYFLFSYLAKISREEIAAGISEYSLIPDNNFNCEQLSDYLMTSPSYSESKYREIIMGDTFVYKLTWKGNYCLIPNSGEKLLAEKLFEL